MIHVVGEHDLAAFRSEWTGARLLAALEEAGGKLLVDWEIGVGKSFAMDDVIEAALNEFRYGLVVVLLPTREVLNERRWIRHQPPDVNVLNLRPRPRERCGDLDRQWHHFETHGLGILGRDLLCRNCPRRSGCYWPSQYGDDLRDADVVFATHAHLNRAPNFLAQLSSTAGAARVLALIDEDTATMVPFRRGITQEDLGRMVAVLEELQDVDADLGRWYVLSRLLQRAGTEDLRDVEWVWPRLELPMVRAIQESGWERFGTRFRYIGFELQQFGSSLLASRERLPNGMISLTMVPWAATDTIVFNSSTSADLLGFRLGKEVVAPFHNVRFSHPQTKWFNIASRTGMRSFFPRNAAQILDFFAALIDKRLREDGRPLLIAKKCFVELCAKEISSRLRDLGHDDAVIVTGDWTSHDFSVPTKIPMINYGVIGINLFQDRTCAYCLTGYYVNEGVVNSSLQDLMASDFHVPIRLQTKGSPRRRVATVTNSQDRFVDLARLAQLVLDRQEMEVVLQAVGRVRPYTRPREVITFQCAAHPRLDYAAEFDTLEDARRYFGISSRRDRAANNLTVQIQGLRQKGLTQAEVADLLCISIATVKRKWNPNLDNQGDYRLGDAGGIMSPSKNFRKGS